MLVLTRFVESAERIDDTLLLTFELRQKSRLRTRAVSGEEVGLFLERGQPLRDGTLLAAEDGRVVVVRAAAETLSHVVAASPTELARAAYHLGNRHVPVEVGDGWLRLACDHVLIDMLARHFDVTLSTVEAPFNPESGAYGGGHHHSHGQEAEFHYAPKLHQFAKAHP
ncbi:urease accessory protein UreE [Crenobacter sp. SG2303]|uniref:Urease accessory protein UreE n=1 Tax=Crenobacter oryzisoli TaxID=3056844 RepID=A0ABT7XKN2_9NEIS|nr:urease accessory protein UreE [Crenobacter sp. SG2303]MDN0074356.1 urease accessory protein UreE [Crenobacter sp. SG2303]